MPYGVGFETLVFVSERKLEEKRKYFESRSCEELDKYLKSSVEQYLWIKNELHKLDEKSERIRKIEEAISYPYIMGAKKLAREESKRVDKEKREKEKRSEKKI